MCHEKNCDNRNGLRVDGDFGGWNVLEPSYQINAGWKRVVEIRETLKEDIRTDINGLLVLKTSNGRAVCVTDNDTVIAEIQYNASGEILSRKGISPLKASLFNESAPKTLTEMENAFGKPHCDIG